MNLFSRLFDGLDDSSRLAIEAPDGGHISYGDLITWAGKMEVSWSRGAFGQVFTGISRGLRTRPKTKERPVARASRPFRKT
jgi:hypothetical protein